MTVLAHRINIEADQKFVFDALSTVEGWSRWFTPEVTGDFTEGSEVVCRLKGRSPIRLRVTSVNPESGIAFEVLEGPFAPGAKTSIELAGAADGRTAVSLRHDTPPIPEEDLAACNSYWGILLGQLRAYSQTRDSAPSLIADSLTHLLDEAAIRDASARFADVATSADYDGFRALWADDAEWVIGGTEGQPFERRANGIDDIVSMLRTLRAERDYFVQFAVQGSIEINGDDAAARCVCHEAARGPGESYYRNNGIWSDRLRRSDNGWVFTSRTYRYLWLDLSPFSGDIFPV